MNNFIQLYGGGIFLLSILIGLVLTLHISFKIQDKELLEWHNKGRCRNCGAFFSVENRSLTTENYYLFCDFCGNRRHVDADFAKKHKYYNKSESGDRTEYIRWYINDHILNQEKSFNMNDVIRDVHKRILGEFISTEDVQYVIDALIKDDKLFIMDDGYYKYKIVR